MWTFITLAPYISLRKLVSQVVHDFESSYQCPYINNKNTSTNCLILSTNVYSYGTSSFGLEKIDEYDT